MATLNAARFTINSDPAVDGAGDRGYDAVHTETLDIELEANPSPATSVTYDVFDGDDLGPSPKASKAAPLLTFVSNGAAQVKPTDKQAIEQLIMPGSGVHSWLIRATVNIPTIDPEPQAQVFERLVVIRATTISPPIRKTVPGESIQYLSRAWSDSINDLIDALISGPGVGEANTATNTGAGAGVFRQKVGVDLEYRSLVSAGDAAPLLSIAETIGPDDEVEFTLNHMFANGAFDDNAFFGVDAGNVGTQSGSGNSGFGSQALEILTSGDRNVGIGAGAGVALTSGDDNVFVGPGAGLTAGTGSRNILIGSFADVPAAGTNDHLNLGDLLFGDLLNDRVRIGGSGVAAGPHSFDIIQATNDQTAVTRIETTGTNGAAGRTFIGDRTPIGNVTGNPGDEYRRIGTGGAATRYVHQGGAANNTDWVDMGRTAERFYVEEEAETTTTGAAFLQKIRLDTIVSIPAGRYKLSWDFTWRRASTNNDIEVRVEQDDATLLWNMRTEPTNNSVTDRNPAAASKEFTLTAGIRTFDLDFRNVSGAVTVGLSRAHMRLERIGP